MIKEVMKMHAVCNIVFSCEEVKGVFSQWGHYKSRITVQWRWWCAVAIYEIRNQFWQCDTVSLHRLDNYTKRRNA